MADFKSILSAIDKHVKLTDAEAAVLLSLLESRSIKANELIAKSNEPSQHFIFVTMGCLMTYYTSADGVEHVLQFATANWWTGDLGSFEKHTPSCYSTRAIADTEVFLITKKGFEELLERVPKLEKYFRIIFQNSLITHGGRIMQAISYTAEERYEAFREKYPTLEQFVPQKYIASYLGVTPEFLSKIRRRLMAK
ncbi:MAG TPA: Crp/Fnr family transcriptional regulator [Cyclobacteriaceae bacterium]|nr:Crp/Fnr family transcriptional regulator [Cyclobacteriaceae bacterium]